MDAILADLKFAARTLRRSPLFTLIAVLSLALGIGANTAIFTVMDQLMLRLLPVKDPETLVMLYQKGSHNGSNMGRRMHSYPIYQDFQKKAAPLAEVICRRQVPTSVSIDNQTERVSAELVSGNFFSVLGVKPAAGRVFNSQEDDQVYGGHASVVIGHDYWVTRFSRDPKVIGKKILVNNYPMTIVGVSAEGFAGLDPAQAPQIRVPILMKAQLMPEQTWIEMSDRRSRWVQVFARLKPGYTPASAQAPLQVLFTQIRRDEMALAAAKDWTPYSRDEFMRGTIHVEQAATGDSQLRNSFSTALVVLMCMVGLVLLIACANVANLLIARAVARQKEIAVRLSVGASRWQLVRQLLIESLLMSFLGAVCGVVLSVWMTQGLLSLIPAEGSPLLLSATPDLRVLGFTLALTFVTGLLFGLVPALKASNPDLWSTLKDAVGSIAVAGGSVLLRKGLVSAQVALSFLLLFGAGLFVRSLQNLKGTETGFNDIDNLVTFQLSPALNGYTDARAEQLYRDLLANIRSSPGVKAAGLSGVGVLSGDEWDSTIKVEGHTAKDGEDMQAFMNSLSPGYFSAMGIALQEGRDFDYRDSDGRDRGSFTEQRQVCIVNRKFADHFFPGKSAVGRMLGWGGGPKTKLNMEIIGVVEDALYEGPREGVHRQVFVSHFGKGSAFVYVRAARDSAALYSVVRGEVRKLDAALPVYGMKTLANQLDQTLLTERLIALLSAGFGALATLLAAIGLYGVMAFVVARRTKEIGLRIALGAPPNSVIWLVMKEVIVLLAIGLAVGLPAALGAGQFIAKQLYGVQARDPGVAGVTMLILVTVAALAGLIPARRASSIDPLIALRYE
ncbi:MAG: ABC transporter permease [Acidobacteria bacterium]|nr:ABC transporter permease [Acidobacteriota bacterium]